MAIVTSAEAALKTVETGREGWRLFRALQRTKPFRSWRHWRANAILEPLHHDVVHSTRRLAARIHNWDRDHRLAAIEATELCTACARCMAHLLALPPNHLHCCLKFISGKDGNGNTRIATFARSRPLDGRPPELGTDKSHLVSKNTVWSALLSGSDGHSVWTNDFTCFCCNDLVGAGESFRCDRERWNIYYKSAMVMAIRYCVSSDDAEMGYVGFLAFDSPIVGAFGKVPSIFKYRLKPAEYKQQLRGSAAFNLAGLIADMLGMFLGPVYQTSAAETVELWNTKNPTISDSPKLIHRPSAGPDASLPI